MNETDITAKLIYKLSTLFRRFSSNQTARAIKAENLTERDISILEYINEKGDVSFSDLVTDYKSVSLSTISNTISKLYSDKIDKGGNLIDKKLFPGDQRKIILSLTKEGKKIVKDLNKQNLESYKEVVKSFHFDGEEEVVFQNILKKSIKHFTDILNNQESKR